MTWVVPRSTLGPYVLPRPNRTVLAVLYKVMVGSLVHRSFGPAGPTTDKDRNYIIINPFTAVMSLVNDQ